MRFTLLLAAALVACAEPVPDPSASATGETPAATRYVTPTIAAAMLDEPQLTVLDVRTPKEHEAGAIPGSVNIDWKREDFAGALTMLDRDAPILLHCESGGRSTAALRLLEAEGFTDLRHLDGGMRAWRAAGLPVTGVEAVEAEGPEQTTD